MILPAPFLSLGLQGVPGLQYPLAGVERLVQGLFLAGRTCQRAWHAKLSLLAYWLADGGFVAQGPLAEGFRWGKVQGCKKGGLHF